MKAGTQSFAGATIANLIGSTLPLLIALATVPYIVRTLGPERFGLIALAWTVIGYFTLFDLGLGRAVTKLGSETGTHDSVSRIHELVAAALRIQLVFGAAAMVALFLAAAPLAHALDVSPELRGETVVAFRLLALSVPAILFPGVYRGAFEALQRFDLVNVLRAPLSAAMYLATLAGALAGASVSAIVALLVLVRFAGWLAHVALFRRVAPRPPTLVRLPGTRRSLLQFGGWVSVTSAFVPLTTYLDRFLIGVFASVGAVAYYAAPYELSSRLLVLAGSVATVLLPAVSKVVNSNSPERLSAQVGQAMRWTAVLLAVPTVILFWLAPPVLAIWLGADYEAASTVAFRLLLVAGLLNGLALIPFTALEGMGRPDLVAKYHMVELPFYVLVTVFLIRVAGIEGAAFAWLLRNAAGLAVLLWLMQRVGGRLRRDQPLWNEQLGGAAK